MFEVPPQKILVWYFKYWNLEKGKFESMEKGKVPKVWYLLQWKSTAPLASDGECGGGILSIASQHRAG